MRLLFFDDFRLGVLKGDAVVDVTDAARTVPHTGPHDLISGLIARFGEYRGRLDEAAAKGKGVPVAQVRIRPPLNRRRARCSSQALRTNTRGGTLAVRSRSAVMPHPMASRRLFVRAPPGERRLRPPIAQQPRP